MGAVNNSPILEWDVTGRTVGGYPSVSPIFLAGFISVSSEHVALSKSCQFKHLSMFTSTCCHFINLGITSLQPFLNILNQHPFLTHSFFGRPARSATADPPTGRTKQVPPDSHSPVGVEVPFPRSTATILPQLVTIGNYETL